MNMYMSIYHRSWLYSLQANLSQRTTSDTTNCREVALPIPPRTATGWKLCFTTSAAPVKRLGRDEDPPWGLCQSSGYVFLFTYGGFPKMGVHPIAGWFIMENPSTNG